MGKINSSYLADYIGPAIDKRYRARSDAADDLGVDQAVISRICSGQWFGVSEHLVENICMRLGLDPAEGLLRLIFGKNPKIKKHFLEITKNTSIKIIPINKYKPSSNSKKPGLENLLRVPFISENNLINRIRKAKGGKSEYTIVPIDWLPKNGNFAAFKIKDVFMSPTLPEKSIIVANLNDIKASNDKVYLFKKKNDVKAGRAFIQDNFLEMRPDNQNRNKHCSYIFDMNKIKYDRDNPILGRIVLAIKKF